MSLHERAVLRLGWGIVAVLAIGGAVLLGLRWGGMG
jgi:hypothetical protein